MRYRNASRVFLDSYAAKQCVRRIHNDWAPDVPAPGPLPDDVRMRISEGRLFESETVVPLLQEVLGDRCEIVVDPIARRDLFGQGSAWGAMNRGVPVIIGARLHPIENGYSPVVPDLLIRVTPDGEDPKYLPADIKYHHTLKPSPRTQATISALADPSARVTVDSMTAMTTHRVEDAMQLAHYTHVLESLGRHPGPHMRWAAILGTQDFTSLTGDRYGLAWYDLTKPTETTWSATGTKGKRKRSILDCYDHEFALRLRIAEAALAGEEFVRPFGKPECAECPYLDYCRDHVGPQDVSFAVAKGQLTDREWLHLYDQGLGTVDALAAASTDGGLLEGYLPHATHVRTPEKRLTNVVRRARMTRDNIPLEREGTLPLDVPTADVEIDFDVEWHPNEGHVYQWGARVRLGQDEATATYEKTVYNFERLDDQAAQALADEFFAWLEGFITDHETAGRTVAVFHWTSPEITKTLRALGDNTRSAALLDRFVDLRAWMADRFFARDGLGLKHVAPLFGFGWRVEDPGGLASVVKIDTIRLTDIAERAAEAKAWLLSYNEDDCAAQAAIRDGLRRQHGAGTAPVTTGSTPVRPNSQNEGEPGPQVSQGGTLTRARSGKRLSMDEIRRRVAQFVIDYKGFTQEKQHTHNFWAAFLRCYGVDDTLLHGINFEYEATRASTGGKGYIDVFFPGHFLIEQKTAGKIKTPKLGGLSNAEEQARDYLTGGDITDAQRPRWVVTSDFTTIQVTDLSQPLKSPNRTRTINFDDLNDHVETFLFLTGEDPDIVLQEEQAEASVQAARLMGDLYAAMTGDSDLGDADEEDERTMEASILLTRLLFLMFGDDANLWEKGLFQTFVETRTQPDGSDLGQQLRALFEVLDTPTSRRSPKTDEAMRKFPYVNGDIYKGASHDKTIWFDTDMRGALIAACRFDWSRISPAVFGSLFQTVKSRAARRFDGEHYTSEENILKVLRPMFLDEYRQRLDAADTKPKLEALHAELKRLRYVDPACGCGNFLIVAYRDMRALELELLVKLKALQGRSGDLVLDPADMLNVRLDQFHGIELNWWPAKIAETAMYLVDHQANQKMLNTLGLTVPRLPIDISANIHHQNALTVEWEDILPAGRDLNVFVFGNPPFMGRKTTNTDQKAELSQAWDTPNTGHLDFVTAWHAKALRYLGERDGEFGFVTTNSICQGEPVSDLFPRIERAGWRIKFAHRTFAWNSEAAAKDRAAVHCTIIGFDRAQRPQARLFDYPTPKSAPKEVRVSHGINGYLVDAPNVYVSARTNPLSPELPKVSFGSMPRDGKHLLVSAAQYADVAADPVAARYLRRFVGADELVNGKERWCLWMADEFDPDDITRSPVLRKRLAAVKEMREDSKADTTREWAKSPHLFVQQAQPTVAYLGIPRHVTESRAFFPTMRFEADVICGDANFLCPDPDGFAFAVISSSMFITWQKTVGGRIKSDLRFSKDIVWNNLPLPAVTENLRAQIIQAGQGVAEARAQHPDRSLAAHYQPLGMAPELVSAHRALDRVVDKAFGVARARTLSEVDRQRILFDRYVEMTNG